jgi:lauroyl/myristoyl acyltransferase
MSTEGELRTRLDADLFAGPRRLRHVMPLLRRLPAPVAAELLAGLAIVDGIVRGRFGRGRRWAAAQGMSVLGSWRLAFDLLANHGRFVAEEALVGLESSDELAAGVELRGAEHLAALGGGALLVGFHLGPPKTWLRLRALGYPVRFAGRLEGAADDPRWQAAIANGAVIRLSAGDAQARLHGLMRIRQLLRGGALVYVTADGPFGREAFSIDLPGEPLVVRQGWLALRRAAHVPTLPVFGFRTATGRRIIVIHPPLPPVDDDATRDAARCRDVLSPLVTDYVRRHPEQCRWVAMPRWVRRASDGEDRGRDG